MCLTSAGLLVSSLIMKTSEHAVFTCSLPSNTRKTAFIRIIQWLSGFSLPAGEKVSVLVPHSLEDSSIRGSSQIFSYSNEDCQCKWPVGLGAVTNWKSCCRSSCPAAQYPELGLGLDLSVFSWMCKGAVFDSVCSAISELLVRAPHTRLCYAA